MRKTIIFGALAALLGLAAVAQAKRSGGNPDMRDNSEMTDQATQDTANDRDGVKQDREARNEHARKRRRRNRREAGRSARPSRCGR